MAGRAITVVATKKANGHAITVVDEGEQNPRSFHAKTNTQASILTAQVEGQKQLE